LPAAVQLAHAEPCLPHAVESLPVTQVVPSQQPPQFCGPHVGVPWQRPPPPPVGVQTWPFAAQFVHASPLVPHAWPAIPVRH
jgi:hypothetical protein